MTIEQSIASLTDASNKLTDAVNGKIGQIDQKVSAAKNDILQFIEGARNEFLIPNLPLAMAENWNGDEHLDNGLAMKALPRQLLFKKYDSTNKKYEGEAGYSVHDSWAPSNDIYPNGAIQVANKFLGTEMQAYLVAFIFFTGPSNKGQYPRAAIKAEILKMTNEPFSNLGTVTEDNFYSTRSSRAFSGIGGTIMNVDFFTLGDSNNLVDGWNGKYPVYCMRPVILTTDTSKFLINGSGEPYLRVTDAKRFIKAVI